MEEIKERRKVKIKETTNNNTYDLYNMLNNITNSSDMINNTVRLMSSYMTNDMLLSSDIINNNTSTWY